MTWISDATVRHLQSVVELPDLSGTRYRIIEEIGRGGMGTVYAAQDDELQRQVAVKVISTAAFDADAADRMLAEARIVAGLEHPGIVPVHDVGSLPDGRIYYVMKLIHGDSLDQIFERTTDIPDKLRVFERICETVAFAHEHGVIHCDLKPHNIMVGSFGEVLVLDWGVARVVNMAVASPPKPKAGDAHNTEKGDADRWDANDTVTLRSVHGLVIGTPAYMSPEQARGDVRNIDHQSDVFALGAILHALLTGAPPIDRTVFQRLCQGHPLVLDPPRRPGVKIPRQIAAICSKALAIDKQERYAAALDLRDDVARYLGGRSVAAYRERFHERLGRLLWLYRAPLGLIAAYLIIRVVMIFWRSR